jgi:hypothetical protein
MQTVEASFGQSNARRGFSAAVASGAGSVASRSNVDIEELRQLNRDKWQYWIDNVLIEWGVNPSQLADDDIDPPLPATIARAGEFAATMQRDNVPAPDRVTFDVNGVIAFENVEPNALASFRIQPEGTIQIVVFRNNELVFSQSW